MLSIIYNSTPLWNFFLENFTNKHEICIVKLVCKNNFLSSRNLFVRLINHVFGHYFSLQKRYKIYGNLNDIKRNDSLLILGIYNYPVLVKLHKLYKNQKKILWLWNPVEKTYRNPKHIIGKLKKIGYEIYTFDRTDAIKYKLGLKTQFTMIPERLLVKGLKINTDLYFLGQPKGREQMLEELKKIYLSLGIQCDFKIVYSPADYISYEDNIRNVISSKCVLEICQEGQHGLTLRALEAMLCHRKLITNNKSIENEDFYNPQNIIIIGVDNNQNVKDFIDSDFVVGDESILKKYDFNNWLNSFIEN